MKDYIYKLSNTCSDILSYLQNKCISILLFIFAITYNIYFGNNIYYK